MPFFITLGNKALKDFEGRDSRILFQLLNLDFDFLEHPTTKWETLKSYQKEKRIVSNLPVVNGAVERVLDLAADTNTKTAPESENKLQDLYKVIRGASEKLRTNATSDETVTKKSLAAVNYYWLSS